MPDPLLKSQLLESPESSSPIVTRAVSAGLSGKYSDPYSLAGWQKTLLHALGMFPQQVARPLISTFQLLTAHSPTSLNNLDLDNLIALRLKDYDHLDREFPTILVGAALGGATAHLALAMEAPFLPQAFVLTLKGGSYNGQAQTYLKRSADLALSLAHKYPGIFTIQHFDPIHDGWLTRWVNHLRIKLISLPKVYIEYIKNHLKPGGAICFLDCSAQWLRHKIGDRSVFQVGGWGDISPEEYLEGSDRINKFCKAEHITRAGWQLEAQQLEKGPESEWGCEPGLAEALEIFCKQERYQFVRISLPSPFDFSRLAFLAVQNLLEKENRSPSGTFIEMFTQFDATAVMKCGLLPLWLVFNTNDNLRFLHQILPEISQELPVFFSPLSTFTFTPDLTPWSDWESTLKNYKWVNVGTRQSHYPSDARTLVNWSRPLRDFAQEHNQPITARLSTFELLNLAKSL